jgi:hypothetical protein
LLIEIIRLVSVKFRGKDHMQAAVFGNYIAMPLLFFAFFIYTQKLEKTLDAYLDSQDDGIWQNRNIETNSSFNSLIPAECLIAESFPVDMKFLMGYILISYVSYPILFYYIIAVTTLMQSAILIYAMVNRRIGQMRRADAREALASRQNPNESISGNTVLREW